MHYHILETELKEEQKAFDHDEIRRLLTLSAAQLLNLSKSIEQRRNDWEVFDLPQAIYSLNDEIKGRPVLIGCEQTSVLTARYHCANCCNSTCEFMRNLKPDRSCVIHAKDVAKIFRVKALSPDGFPDDCPSYLSESFEVQGFI